MMKKEYHYLIALTNAYLHEEAVVLDENINYYTLSRTAKAHNLLAVIFCVINKAKNRDIVPKKCFDAMQDYFFDMVYRYEQQKTALNELKAILTTAEIPYALFKGSVIKEAYPVPESRLMGDIDILIKREDRDRFKSAMFSAGYQCNAMNGPVFDYRKGEILIEAHTNLINGKVGASSASKCFENAMQEASFRGCEGTFDDTFHFAYLIAHIAHHFWFYGAGVKLILDLAVIMNTCVIDMDKVFSKLAEAGLEHFAKVILSVCCKWYQIGTCYTDDTEKTEEFLVSFGAFGYNGRNTSAVFARKKLEEGKRLSPFRLKLSLAFPSYQTMKEIPYIKFIDGRPWLMLYAWCYRFYYNLRFRKNFMTKTVGNFKKKEIPLLAQKELEFFEEIGLL